MNKIKYRCITITGKSGTGTSSLGKRLAKSLGWEFISPASDFFRDIRKKETHKDYIDFSDDLDKEVDGYVALQLKSSQHVIFDGRLTGYLAQDHSDAFKILLTSSLPVRIERVRRRGDESKKEMLKRDADENIKYPRIYGTNPLDPKYFDLIIQNDNTPVEKEVNYPVAETTGR